MYSEKGNMGDEFAMAPDFTLVDTHGAEVSLSDYRDKKHVVLIFNRGFM